MTAVSSQSRRTRQAMRSATLTVAFLTMALAVAACGASHQLAELEAMAAESDAAATRTARPGVSEQRTTAPIYCEDLEIDPLRGPPAVDCYQGSAQNRAQYEKDALNIGPGDFMDDL